MDIPNGENIFPQKFLNIFIVIAELIPPPNDKKNEGVKKVPEKIEPNKTLKKTTFSTNAKGK